MPTKLTDILNDTVDVLVKFDRHEINLKVSPAAITTAQGLELAEKEAVLEEGDRRGATRMMATVLVTLIKGWDIIGDDGEMLPISEATLLALPARLLPEMSNAVREVLAPNGSKSAT